MPVTLITPTADRPEAFALCEKWMARQALKYDQWIVADDGEKAQRVTMGQTVVRRERTSEGAQSLCDNLLAAIDKVNGDYVAIIENDDYYTTDHLQFHVERLSQYDASGGSMLRYYHIGRMGFRVLKNTNSALCNLVFKASLLEDFRRVVIQCRDDNDYNVDRRFWRAIKSKDMDERCTVIGIKGMPGRHGLGAGHRSIVYKPDPDGDVLRKWIGGDARYYIP